MSSTALVVKDWRRDIENSAKEYQRALPQHLPTEKFVRVVSTAIGTNPALAKADRTSLLSACMKAAQDGLLPDGREGALVTFRTKAKDGTWVDAVQWLPMLQGLLKKARNSGEIAAIFEPQIVYENDHYHVQYGLDPDIQHRPKLTGARGEPIFVYAVAKLRDGSTPFVILTMEEVAKVRNASRAKDRGPWVDWWEEMTKKTALRRLNKYLPSSSDKEGGEGLLRALERDDEEPELTQAGAAPGGRPAAPATLEEFAAVEDAAEPEPEPGSRVDEDGVVHEAGPPAAGASPEPEEPEAEEVWPLAIPGGKTLHFAPARWPRALLERVAASPHADLARKLVKANTPALDRLADVDLDAEIGRLVKELEAKPRKGSAAAAA